MTRLWWSLCHARLGSKSKVRCHFGIHIFIVSIYGYIWNIMNIYGIYSPTFLLEIFMVVFHCRTPSAPQNRSAPKKIAPAMENPMKKQKPNELLWLVPLTTCTTTFTPPQKKNPILAPSTPTYRKTLHAQPPSPLSPFGEPGDLPSTTPLRLFA